MAEQVVDSRGKPRVQTVNDEPSKTVQSQAHLADMSYIMERYGATGIIDGLNQTEMQFADVSEHTDYAQLMRTVAAAEEQFMKLPSKVREEFNHDVAKWLDAAHDAEKRQALVDAGVIDDVEGSPPDPETGPAGSPEPAVPAE